MKKYLLSAVILLTATIFGCSSCGDKKTDEEKIFTFNDGQLKAQYKTDETVSLELMNPQSKVIDSIIYYVNEKNVGAIKGAGKMSFPLKEAKFGYQNLKALIYYEGKTAEASERIELISNVQPALLKYTLVNTFSHDITSFTEGLEFYRDTLYESGGQYGTSKLFKYDYTTGKVFKNQNLEAKYFAEGITILDNKIYQLTYKENTGFIYNADTWKLEKTFTYDKQIEGWGMTNDGKFIYQSDGTEKIWKMDPATQKMVDYVNVYSESGKIKSVNELEYINGKIYGNIWQKDAIAIIDPASGAVTAILNLAGLRKELKNPNAEVLNGIAYNVKTKTIFVTGKNWDKMFEIRVSE